METWLRDLKARLDGEAQAKQHELREAFESDCADLLAEIAEAAQKEKEDAIRHLLMDFKVGACVYECALCLALTRPRCRRPRRSTSQS